MHNYLLSGQVAHISILLRVTLYARWAGSAIHMNRTNAGVPADQGAAGLMGSL